jgi:tRNA pseudouridine32 synthase/23S rRNA pseudouridine746 synthase
MLISDFFSAEIKMIHAGAIAARPSEITLPPVGQGFATVFEFLLVKFPRITPEIWQARIEQGKVFWHDGSLIDLQTPFQPSRRLCYFREVAHEPIVPFSHSILFQNEHIVIACKPHFLPVIPGGDFVNECLLERVRQATQLADLAPVHRLDKETAGLVMFSCNSQSRALYHQLFATGAIEKSYLAVARLPAQLSDLAIGTEFRVENRLEKSDPRFLMQEVIGEVNARSRLQLIDKRDALGLFRLWPETGKTHQLRLHMQAIGAPILHDKYYPQLLAKQQDFSAMPLQLLAQQLAFIDPVCGSSRIFSSTRQLAEWPE